MHSRQLYYPYGGGRYTYGTNPTDYQFTGQRHEAGLGLYDYHARFYDPYINRFISADTMVPNPGNPQDFNRYSYVRNSPLNYTDSSGHAMIANGGGGYIPRHPPLLLLPTAEILRQQVLNNLETAGPTCQHAAQYIIENDIQISFAMPLIGDVGAWWTRAGNIALNLKYYPLHMQTNPDNAGMLGLIVHEAKHLEQGGVLALTVEGELEAWATEFYARDELAQAGLGYPLGSRRRAIAQLYSSSPTGRDLRKARSEMMTDQGVGYPIWALPLRPERFWQVPLASLVFPPLALGLTASDKPRN